MKDMFQGSLPREVNLERAVRRAINAQHERSKSKQHGKEKEGPITGPVPLPRPIRSNIQKFMPFSEDREAERRKASGGAPVSARVPDAGPDDWKTRLETAVAYSCVHSHTFTCRKAPTGHFRCRVCQPSYVTPVGIKTKPDDPDQTKLTCQVTGSDKTTRNLVQDEAHFFVAEILEPTEDKHDVRSAPLGECEVQPGFVIKRDIQPQEQPEEDQPIPPRDQRVIIYEPVRE